MTGWLTVERFIYSASNPTLAVRQVLLSIGHEESQRQCKDLRMSTETTHVGENSVYMEIETSTCTLIRVQRSPVEHVIFSGTENKK